MASRRLLHNSSLLFPVVVSLVALLLQCLGEWGFAHFSFQRDASASGELWRLLSAHFVHEDFAHLLLNLAGLWLLWALLRTVIAPLQWWLLLLSSTAFIGLCLYLLHPSLIWYIGLSGVLHGFWSAGALLGLQRAVKGARLFTLLLVLKLGAEAVSGGGLTVTGVVTEAHLYGALWGIIFGSLMLFRRS